MESTSSRSHAFLLDMVTWEGWQNGVKHTGRSLRKGCIKKRHK